MKQAKLPQNEDQRLAALYQSQLLDSIREESFDAITMITAQTCDMPIALICLVDAKRVWFKSKQGIDNVSEIPRDIGFCSHTVTQSNVMEVKDATVDERFFDNPMVAENNFQYYAGAPLITLDGLALGTLCVMDKKPRELSEDHKEFLKRMAFTVVALIEARINSNKSPLIKNHHFTLNNASNEQRKDQKQTALNEHTNHAKVYIIDDDINTAKTLTTFFSQEGLAVEIFSSPKHFLSSYHNQAGCVISEIKFTNDLDETLQKQFKEQDISIPVIFIAKQGDIPTSVAAMRAGAIDFLEKPLDKKLLLQRVFEGINLDAKQRKQKEKQKLILDRLNNLTLREKEVMMLLVKNRAKLSNKTIAEKLTISVRTVEVHRSTIMAKMLASSRLELLEIAEICEIPTN